MDKDTIEEMKKSYDLIINRKSNYSKEAEKHWISDNWIRKRFKLLWRDVKKTAIIHHGRYVVKCTTCKKEKEVEHNDLKDYRKWWYKTNFYCNSTCRADDQRKSLYHK